MTGPWYCGVDPSSTKVGVAAISEGTGEVRFAAIHVKGSEFPRRFVEVRIAIRLFLQPLADDGVCCVVVERPTTTKSGATLGGAFGVAIEAAASMLPTAAIHDLSPQQIDGHARVAGYSRGDRKTSTASRAYQLGYRGDSQDVADAVVCAAAARTLTERATRRAA